MEFAVRKDGEIVVVEPTGDIDGKTAPEFQDKMLQLIQPGARIVLNLSGVAFMSSSGLRSMLLIYRQAKAQGVKLVLAGVNKDIRGSMSATGFLSFFVLCESFEDAMKAVS